jgi:hypothetical protein
MSINFSNAADAVAQNRVATLSEIIRYRFCKSFGSPLPRRLGGKSFVRFRGSPRFAAVSLNNERVQF